MNGKASGNSLLGSKRFQVITGGGGIFALVTVLDIFPEGETIALLGQDVEISSVIIIMALSLAVLYGLQDIMGTFMNGLVRMSEVRAMSSAKD